MAVTRPKNRTAITNVPLSNNLSVPLLFVVENSESDLDPVITDVSPSALPPCINTRIVKIDATIKTIYFRIVTTIVSYNHPFSYLCSICIVLIASSVSIATPTQTIIPVPPSAVVLVTVANIAST